MKLFFRFPNLESVHVYHYSVLFQDFNDQVCQEFIEHCPKLKRFEVIPATLNPDELCELLHKVRLLLTTVDVDDIKTNEKSLIDCVADFPRVQELYDQSGHFSSFQLILPVFDRLEHVQSIYITSIREDQTDFAETYIASKSKDQQNLIIQRLSKVKDVKWKYQGGLNTDSAMFINKYLTGLDILGIHSTVEQKWRYPRMQQTFRDYILESFCSAKFYSSLVYDKVEDLTLGDCFSDIVKSVFNDAPSNINRILKVNLHDIFFPRCDLLSLEVESSPPRSYRMITIVSPNVHLFKEVMDRMMEHGGHLNDVDELILEIPQDEQMFSESYYEILAYMSSLKKVTLQVPKKVVEKPNEQPYGYYDFLENEPTMVNEPTVVKELTMVNELTIKVHNCYTEFPSLLYQLSKRFPNLKYLKMDRFCGVWEDGTLEFQVKLASYSLECLTLDITRVKIDMQSNNVESDFFVVDVKFLANAKRYSYKVSVDLSSVALVHDGDLEGLTCGEDYLCVHVIVKKLKKLVLCMHQYKEASQYLEKLTPSYLETVVKSTITIED